MELDKKLIGRAIRKGRKALGLTQGDLGARFGVTREAVSLWESGKNLPDTGNLLMLHRTLPDGLPYMMDDGESADTQPSRSSVRLVGYVGAGAQIFPIDDHEKGAGLDEVEAPPGPRLKDIVAVKVRGDSMMPAYEDGDIIYYGEHEADPRNVLGKVVVVCLEDGRILLKRLGRGREAGCFDLISHNGPVMEDQRLQWVARFQWVKKG